ncbi:MarR family winged helix-turn-helix transcriptional regulator [Massilia sp. ZL223]|uniref:MarR family winged helix-turn-helix transcriptional regulator n=1 Tax=Massilia sp. ZL223 TaxID=2824904 RepID=UPI001B83C0E7|nr:MarR family transcriptional regulator [Massilia sp. ZL223]MBQ5964489.1 MarR family transcriptional regulator [Massilia sp. ZL223]
MKQGLGTQLRHLIELLDSAVEAAYVDADLPDYRPRYTPVMRVLSMREAVTIGEIAALAGITQPAATQTVALMQKQGLVQIAPGAEDARQRVVSLSAKGSALLPRLQECWRATKLAADGLDADLDLPLSQSLAQAIAALADRPFGERIREARLALQQDGGSKATGQDSRRRSGKKNAA